MVYKYDENCDGQPQESRPQDSDPMLELPEIPETPAQDREIPRFSDGDGPRRRSGWKSVAAAVALIAVGAGVGSATTMVLAPKFNQSSTPIGVVGTGTVQPVASTPFEGQSSVIPGIYQRVVPSVVAIRVQTQRGWLSGSGTGSGFVVDPDGYILTNNHVIEGASRIQVKFVDGTQMDAEVISADENQDLAVIKVDPGTRKLVAAPLGDSDAVQVGELAVAIGTPFEQEFTVTAGIVSALDRSAREADNPFGLNGLIQTDAAINPGNSGGPLLNAKGEVIGINTLIETGNSGVRGNIGLGFAVPINTAKEILPTLMAGERVEYPWLGVSLGDMNAEVAKQIGATVTEGAVVGLVYRNSPAAEAGLRSAAYDRYDTLVFADVIVAVDGKSVKTADDVVNYVASKKVGDKIKLEVVRGDERLTVTATLKARPNQL